MLIGLGILGLTLAGTQVATYISTSKTKERPYRTIYQSGKIEVREYPSVNVIRYVSVGTMDETKNSNFRALAGYIFGDNQSGSKISMTSPVEMHTNSDSSIMDFMVPTDLSVEELPKPNNKKIQLKKTDHFFAATITYGGWSNDTKLETYKARLAEFLDKANLKHEADYSFLGYNPPYQIIGRKNEVLIRLDTSYTGDEILSLLVE